MKYVFLCASLSRLLTLDICCLTYARHDYNLHMLKVFVGEKIKDFSYLMVEIFLMRLISPAKNVESIFGGVVALSFGCIL